MKHRFTTLIAIVSLLALFSADLSITASSLVPSSKAKFANGIAGATITGGQAVSVSKSSGKYVLADANDDDLSNVAGIAAHGASANQPLAIITEDPECTLGATLSMSAPIYVLSSTAGGIAPAADVGDTEYPVIIGIAISTTKINLKPRVLRGSAAAVAP
jgi:hypothetical protein